MRVLITGAAGMLGHDLIAACARRGHEVVPLGHGELEITDGAAVDAAVARHAPEVVFNCAAWTDVDGAESDERGAMAINDTGAGLVAAAAAAHGAAVVHISTDYVFDGGKREPYVESDLPAAISAYGRSKQAGETAVAAANPRHWIVRTSALFGSGGPNFVETMLRLAGEQSEVVVVADQVTAPTYIPHLAAALALLIESDQHGIHHIAAAGSCSWYEFAQEIFDQAGLECRVMSGTSTMLDRAAPRPAYSVLTSERPDRFRLPPWRRGLAEYLAARRRGAGSAEVAERAAQEVSRG